MLLDSDCVYCFLVVQVRTRNQLFPNFVFQSVIFTGLCEMINLYSQETLHELQGWEAASISSESWNSNAIIKIILVVCTVSNLHNVLLRDLRELVCKPPLANTKTGRSIVRHEYLGNVFSNRTKIRVSNH